MKKDYLHYHCHHYYTGTSGEIKLCCIKFLMVTSILIFPICTPFQPHQPWETISSCSSINQNYYAGQIIFLTE